MAKRLGPLPRLGVGQPACRDTVIPAVRTWMALGDELLAMQLDVKNAFNCMSTQHILRTLESQDDWRMLLPLAQCKFAQHGNLWMREGESVQTVCTAGLDTAATAALQADGGQRPVHHSGPHHPGSPALHRLS